MSSVGNHASGESFLSKIDIFKPTARNNSAEKTSSEAITLWGGVKISCLPESLNFGLRKIHDSIYYALPHEGKAMSNFYGPSSSPTPSLDSAKEITATSSDPTNPSESQNNPPATEAPNASIEKRSLPKELLNEINAHAGYGPSSLPAPLLDSAKEITATSSDPTNPSESQNNPPATEAPNASIEKRSLPEELLAQIKFLGDLQYIRGDGMFTKNSEGQDVFTTKQLDGVKMLEQIAEGKITREFLANTCKVSEEELAGALAFALNDNIKTLEGRIQGLETNTDREKSIHSLTEQVEALKQKYFGIRLPVKQSNQFENQHLSIDVDLMARNTENDLLESYKAYKDFLVTAKNRLLPDDDQASVDCSEQTIKEFHDQCTLYQQEEKVLCRKMNELSTLQNTIKGENDTTGRESYLDKYQPELRIIEDLRKGAKYYHEAQNAFREGNLELSTIIKGRAEARLGYAEANALTPDGSEAGCWKLTEEIYSHAAYYLAQNKATLPSMEIFLKAVSLMQKATEEFRKDNQVAARCWRNAALCYFLAANSQARQLLDSNNAGTENETQNNNYKTAAGDFQKAAEMAKENNDSAIVMNNTVYDSLANNTKMRPVRTSNMFWQFQRLGN